jgi:apolipoprotein N-acyltransferase
MTAGLSCYWGLFAVAFPVVLSRPWLTLVGTGVLWTASEFARGHVFIGFPWLFIGYAATGTTQLARLSQVTGVYGLSFLAAVFNAGIFLVIRHPQQRNWRLRLAIAFMILAGFSFAQFLVGPEHPTESAYLLQTNVPLDLEWTLGYRAQFLREMEAATIGRYARNESRPGLIVWPETPAPLYYHQDLGLRAELATLARTTESPMLLSTVTYDGEGTERPLNSTVAIDRHGIAAGQYDKVELVPFGEHVPYATLFFFAGKLTAEVGDFVPGQHYATLPGVGKSRVAVTICYEAGFPELVRELVSRGANVIVNQSNDGWFNVGFGESPARRQQLLMARMRAIENDRWVLRATNDGLTAVIDPAGRVESFPGSTRAVYFARYGLRSSRTIYTAWGDWFGLLCVGASVALAGIGARKGRI